MSTPKELYLEERRQAILRRIMQQSRVTVAELSQTFGVSEVTVRADLQALAEQNLVVRTHGGAVAVSGSLADLALGRRRQQHPVEKQHIGVVAAGMIGDGDSVFLDSSSTALAIAQQLKNHRQITVISNSIAVAQELLDAPGVAVVMAGGALQKDMASMIGAAAHDFLRRFNIQKGFFGAHGISMPEGLTDISADEADFKRPVVAMCRQVIAVLDASKWGRVGLASFAAVEQVHTILTDRHAPAELVIQAGALGPQVILV